MRLGGMSQRHSEIPRSAMLRDHERQGGSPLVRGPLHTDTPIGRGTYPTDGTWLSLQPIVPLKFRITLVRAVGGRAQVCIRVLSLTPDPRELPGSTQVLDRPMLGGRSELLRRRLELEKPLVSGSVQVDAVPLIPAYTLHIKHLAHAPAREVIERPCAGIRDDEAQILASDKKKVVAYFRRLERPAEGMCPREVVVLPHPVAPRVVISFARALKGEPHSTRRSAFARRDAGIVRPSAFAVARLIANSYLVGSSTASSAGLAPFRILSTCPADRRKMSAKSVPYEIKPPALTYSFWGYSAGRRLLLARLTIREPRQQH